MPKEKPVVGYVIVQHSAAGYKSDPTFAQGLETRPVEDKYQAELILQNGGVIFGTYKAATAYEHATPYPAGYEGMVPRAPGKFSTYAVDGLRVYQP